MRKPKEPDEVRRWRDARPDLARRGLEIELAECAANGGPADAFRAYLDAIDASLAAQWQPPDRDAAMRLVTVAICEEVRSQNGLSAKRPLGNSDIGGDIAKAIGLDLDSLPVAEGSCHELTGQRREAYEWCSALWTEWPTWLRERMEYGK